MTGLKMKKFNYTTEGVCSTNISFEIKYTKDNTRCYMAPTHSIALSKAKWLRREFANIVGRTEIIPFLLY